MIWWEGGGGLRAYRVFTVSGLGGLGTEHLLDEVRTPGFDFSSSSTPNPTPIPGLRSLY